MKAFQRFLAMALCLCLLLGDVSMLPVRAEGDEEAIVEVEPEETEEAPEETEPEDTEVPEEIEVTEPEETEAPEETEPEETEPEETEPEETQPEVEAEEEPDAQTAADAEVMATSGKCGDNVTWSLSKDGTLTISGTGPMKDYYTNAPWGSSKIKKVVVSAGVTTIGDYAFYFCSNLTEVELPSSVTSLGDDCFAWCDSLTRISIPDTVTSLGKGCFYDCSSLTSITIPSSVTSLGDYCFSDCTSLTSITIPSSVTSLGRGCFSYCTSLTSITIPSSVTSLGSFCFDGCSSLTSITIPASVTSIGSFCFEKCTSLTRINVDSKNPKYCSVDGVQFSKDRTELLVCPAGRGGAYAVPAGTIVIADYAFYGCSKITSVSLPDSVTDLGEWCFYGCSGLTDITLPESITEIGRSAFMLCTGLTKVTIPCQITLLKHSVFWQCFKLREITLPKGLAEVGSTVVFDCGKLEKVIFTGNAPQFEKDAFEGCDQTVTAYYPAGTKGWSDCVGKNYGGHLKWVEYKYCELFSHEIDETRWAGGRDGHWHPCKYCGMGNKTVAHTPNRAAASAGNPKVCTVCGYAITSVISVTKPQQDLVSGNTMKLTADFAPRNETDAKVVWMLGAGDSEYASLDSSGNLTAKAVTEAHTVTVSASVDDGSALLGQTQVTIRPTASVVRIYMGNADVTGMKLAMQVYPNESGRKLTLRAAVIPEDVMGTVQWTASSELSGKLTDNKDGTCTLEVDWNSKNFTVTAASADGKKSAKVTVFVTNTFLADAITWDGDSYKAGSTLSITGGQTIKLQTKVTTPLTSGKNVSWSLSEPAYADMTTSGSSGTETCTLKTKPVTEPVVLTLTASLDADPDQAIPVKVRLLPQAFGIAISAAKPIRDGMLQQDFSQSMALQLGVTAQPKDAGASGTWKSSAPKTAEVDKTGRVVFHKAGTVTITFTDSASGLSDSIQVNGGIPMRSLSFQSYCSNTVTSGSTTPLFVQFNTDASLNKLRWSVSNPKAAAVSDSGVVTGLRVYEKTAVTVRAEATDGSGVYAEWPMTVEPNLLEFSIRYNGKRVNDSTVFVATGTSGIQLSAERTCAVTSSSSAVAAPSMVGGSFTGEVILKKPGTATLTFKDKNNVYKAQKVTIIVGNPVKGLVIQVKSGSTTLASGKGKVTLTAVPTNGDAYQKAVTWSSSNPAVASVNASGAVTAKAGILTTTQVTITASAKDGSGVTASQVITVTPVSKAVRLTAKTGFTTADGLTVRPSLVLSGKTQTVDCEKTPILQFAAAVSPAGVSQEVSWKSSSAKVAEVDSTGKVTLLGTGSVTITATATDGSKKAASVKLKVVRLPSALRNDTPSLTVQSGKKLTLNVTPITAAGFKPTDSSLMFNINPADSAYMTISAKGVITTKKVTSAHTVNVTVSSKANPSVKLTIPVRIIP